MKYDPDVALQILRAIEEYPKDELKPETYLLGEIDKELYYFHCRLLKEAGFITIYRLRTEGGNCYWPRELSWPGVQFLEQFRNDSLWQRAKAEARSRGVGMALNTLFQLGAKLAQAQINL